MKNVYMNIYAKRMCFHNDSITSYEYILKRLRNKNDPHINARKSYPNQEIERERENIAKHRSPKIHLSSTITYHLLE